ncbi:hypothetical protein [Senegalia massiliensis]|nr:hypothetical protein [Senegalia massiliensis]
MALNKDYEDSAGIIISYWNIPRIEIKKLDDYVRIFVYGYINADTRNSGKTNATERIFIINNDEGLMDKYFSAEQMDFYNENIYELGYRYLKENETMFEDAIDIIE